MRRILVAAALVLAGLSAAAPRAAAADRLPVRVVAPAPGTELTVGELAVVEWEVPEGGLDRRIVEWEAFLSLDGGQTWQLRLTPHLDIGIRRFSFRVPAFPSRDARLLLRFGDEQEETEVDVPGSFTISAGPARFADPMPSVLRLSRGESARRGEGGVVVWTEGSRDGGGLREVAAQETTQEWEAVQAARSLLLPVLWPAPDREVLTPPGAADLELPASAGERAPAETAAPRPAPAIRLFIHRYNE